MNEQEAIQRELKKFAGADKPQEAYLAAFATRSTLSLWFIA